MFSQLPQELLWLIINQSASPPIGSALHELRSVCVRWDRVIRAHCSRTLTTLISHIKAGYTIKVTVKSVLVWRGNEYNEEHNTGKVCIEYEALG